MKKRRASIILTLIFLVQVTGLASGSAVDPSVLNPSLKTAEAPFQQIYSATCLAISLYKLDAIEGRPKAAIREVFSAIASQPEVRFDLEHMEIGKKGWTRYYPVSIGNKHFIVRIFLTREGVYQPKAPVLFEVVVQNPAVTCQLLPALKDMLETKKIGPVTFTPDISVATSL